MCVIECVYLLAERRQLTPRKALGQGPPALVSGKIRFGLEWPSATVCLDVPIVDKRILWTSEDP